MNFSNIIDTLVMQSDFIKIKGRNHRNQLR